MSKPPRPAMLRHRAEPAVIAAAYLVVLVVPWVLTCVLSSRTVRQSVFENSGAVTRETAEHLHRVSFLIDALNFIAAVAALPAIYALLARAAVVFSQRTDNRKTLNVKQLFALADRNFVGYGLAGNYGTRSNLFLLGAALVLLAVVVLPIRAILVHTEVKLFPEAVLNYRGKPDTSVPNGWVGERVGLDPPVINLPHVPRNLAVEKTRHALIDAFPAEWTAAAWYDPDPGWATNHRGRYFASSLTPGTTTGMYRQHALRLNSSSSCDEILASEVPVPCPGSYNLVLDTSYTNENLTVHVCVPHDRSVDWNWSENRQELKETMYITVSSPVYRYNGTAYSDYALRCVGETSMGYFELGNSFNAGKFGPLLSSFEFPWYGNDPDYGHNPMEFTDQVTEPSFYYRRPGDSYVLEKDYGRDERSYRRAAGPLSVAAHAMFGAGSFFELAQSITGPNDTLSLTLCQLSPIPFRRTDSALRSCDPEDTSPDRYPSGIRNRFSSRYGWANDRVEALIAAIRETNGTVTSLLSTAMHLAGQATLELAVGSATEAFGGWKPHQIWRADGIPISTHVVSTVALVVVTVLLGLQVVGILALVWYIYRVPTWTATLDAMAVARLTRQLADRDGGFLRSDALLNPTKEEVGRMEDMDALVGLVEHERLERPADNTAAPKDSDEVTLAEGATPDPDPILSIGAPGLIPRGMKKASTSSV